VKAVELAKITQNSGKKNPNLLLIVADLDLHHRSPTHHLLDAEADWLCNAQRQERSEARRDSRAWHYERKLQNQGRRGCGSRRSKQRSSNVIGGARAQSRKRSSRGVCLAGVSVRRVEDITEALWGTGILPSTVSDLNKRFTERSRRPADRERTPLCLPGRHRAQAQLDRRDPQRVAIGVNDEGYRDSWHLRRGEGGQGGLERFAQESQQTWPARCPAYHLGRLYGLSGSAAEFFPDAAWQRCVVGSLKT
jgi:putative transposase